MSKSAGRSRSFVNTNPFNEICRIKKGKNMSASSFQFKQFTVRHDQCAMKVGTDGVLLGAWATAAFPDAHPANKDTELTAKHHAATALLPDARAANKYAEPTAKHREATAAFPDARLANKDTEPTAKHHAATAFLPDARPANRDTTALRQAACHSDRRKFLALDVGTGTGLIALMIAQRNAEAEVDAVDIDHDACKQAAENVERSPFKDRIRVFHQSFPEYTTARKYDLIVSNPPYFSDSLKSPDKKRNAARHNDNLPLKLLIEHAMTMLADDGKIALILPVTSSDEMDFIIATHRLYLLRRTAIVSVEGLKPKRFLIELSVKAPPGYAPITDQLILTTTQQERTRAYNHLTEDFYL
jgi:tRNA1Val (adenine37-N6)-methyltransferase